MSYERRLIHQKRRGQFQKFLIAVSIFFGIILLVAGISPRYYKNDGRLNDFDEFSLYKKPILDDILSKMEFNAQFTPWESLAPIVMFPSGDRISRIQKALSRFNNMKIIADGNKYYIAESLGAMTSFRRVVVLLPGERAIFRAESRGNLVLRNVAVTSDRLDGENFALLYSEGKENRIAIDPKNRIARFQTIEKVGAEILWPASAPGLLLILGYQNNFNDKKPSIFLTQFDEYHGDFQKFPPWMQRQKECSKCVYQTDVPIWQSEIQPGHLEAEVPPERALANQRYATLKIAIDSRDSSYLSLGEFDAYIHIKREFELYAVGSMLGDLTRFQQTFLKLQVRMSAQSFSLTWSFLADYALSKLPYTLPQAALQRWTGTAIGHLQNAEKDFQILKFIASILPKNNKLSWKLTHFRSVQHTFMPVEAWKDLSIPTGTLLVDAPYPLKEQAKLNSIQIISEYHIDKILPDLPSNNFVGLGSSNITRTSWQQKVFFIVPNGWMAWENGRFARFHVPLKFIGETRQKIHSFLESAAANFFNFSFCKNEKNVKISFLSSIPIQRCFFNSKEPLPLINSTVPPWNTVIFLPQVASDSTLMCEWQPQIDRDMKALVEGFTLVIDGNGVNGEAIHLGQYSPDNFSSGSFTKEDLKRKFLADKTPICESDKRAVIWTGIFDTHYE